MFCLIPTQDHTNVYRSLQTTVPPVCADRSILCDSRYAVGQCLQMRTRTYSTSWTFNNSPTTAQQNLPNKLHLNRHRNGTTRVIREVPAGTPDVPASQGAYPRYPGTATAPGFQHTMLSSQQQMVEMLLLHCTLSHSAHHIHLLCTSRSQRIKVQPAQPRSSNLAKPFSSLKSKASSPDFCRFVHFSSEWQLQTRPVPSPNTHCNAQETPNHEVNGT